METPKPMRSARIKLESSLEYIIFASRWLQAPIYFGIIAAQITYTYKFIDKLIHIIGSAKVSTEQQLILGILSLVDFTMVANLLAMVIIGGYAIFVSELNRENHDDKPDWLDHIDPGAIKAKLASSLIDISSINLIRSFIDISVVNIQKIKRKIIIHMSFIFSTVFLSLSEYIMSKKHSNSHN